MRWLIHWEVDYKRKGLPYLLEDQVYLTRKALNDMSQGAWDCIAEKERWDLLNRELWVPANLDAWKSETKRT